MARFEVETLLWRIGETAMAWRGARDATEAAALVATYHGLLHELGARGLDADALDLLDTLPDVLMRRTRRRDPEPGGLAQSGLPDRHDNAINSPGRASALPASSRARP